MSYSVTWTSMDRCLATPDREPDEVVHRHCHHCRPSPRRPSCASCCPRLASPVAGVSTCSTPPSSPRVTYTTLPLSPKVTHSNTLSSPRSTSPDLLSPPESRDAVPLSPRWGSHHEAPVTVALPARKLSENSGVSVSNANGAITITVAVASAATVSVAPVPRSVSSRGTATQLSARPKRDTRADVSQVCNEAQRRFSAPTEFRCRRGLLDDCVSTELEPAAAKDAAAVLPCTAGG